MDSFLDTSPPAPSLPMSTSLSRSSSTKSYSTSKSFTTGTDRSPISETPINSAIQSQLSPSHTPLVHIPHPDSVAKYIPDKPPEHGSAINTSRKQPQLDTVRIPDSTYFPLPSELESSRTSQLYPIQTPQAIFHITFKFIRRRFTTKIKVITRLDWYSLHSSKSLHYLPFA